MYALAEIRRLRKGGDDSRDGAAGGHTGRSRAKGELAGKSARFRLRRRVLGLPSPRRARKLPAGRSTG
ncbi:hypothetical protein DM292_16095 [Stutzerimonas frequens]|nr:hypothetical protein DM292_16095 [Stutzerimonas frequens]MBK3759060.1 hypothetical protein [Stutzerimonas frequens]MBK3873306.1 hypothetical protein [Stutzerimonas frequens]MBK3911575.1 hypothetical protein [Stutzerimonas frequens]MBK3918488.1 hypothetical protein [Stutzerimonas frequens]